VNKSVVVAVTGGVVLGVLLAVGGFFLAQRLAQPRAQRGQQPDSAQTTTNAVPRVSLAHNTEVSGVAPSLYGDTIAFFSSEEALGMDLNGDGDLKDNILRSYDVRTSQLSPLDVQGVEPVLYRDQLIFHTSEGKAQADLNGDGDMKDTVIRFYDMTKHALSDTVLTGGFPAVDGDIVAFHTFERWVDRDLNGDGDTEDMVIQYYNMNTHKLTNTGIEGARASISGDVIAFHTFEFLSKQDVNGDGDAEDVVVRLYNVRTGKLSPTVWLGKYPALAGQRLVFEANEAALDRDVNGDGDTQDSVVRVYDLSTQTFDPTPLMGAFPALDGRHLVYSAFEPQMEQDLNADGDQNDSIIQLYNLAAQEHTQTGMAGTSPSIYKNRIAFYTHESWVNQDLNGDGLIGDYVVQFYDLQDP